MTKAESYLRQTWPVDPDTNLSRVCVKRDGVSGYGAGSLAGPLGPAMATPWFRQRQGRPPMAVSKKAIGPDVGYWDKGDEKGL